MKRLLGGAFIITIFVATPARADSDGYFCVGTNYIAYQFGLAAPPVGPHKLTVVRFGNQGLGKPVVVDLPQFQVHGKVCAEGAIRIAAFDAIYTVPLASDGKPIGVVTSEPLSKRGQFPSEFVLQRNLAGLSKPVWMLKTERLALGRSSAGHTFELQIRPTQGKIPCVTEITTSLVELDEMEKTVANQPVFKGEGHRDCGG
jgi:hypothetical protein